MDIVPKYITCTEIKIFPIAYFLNCVKTYVWLDRSSSRISRDKKNFLFFSLLPMNYPGMRSISVLTRILRFLKTFPTVFEIGVNML